MQPTGSRLQRARSSLRGFRQGSLLAVALTSLLLLFVEAAGAQAGSAADEPRSQVERVEDVAGAVGEEARGAFGEFGASLLENLPRFAIVVGLLVAAWAASRVLRYVVRHAFGRWPRSTAALAVTTLLVWLVAVGLSISILVGDVRAFVGSIGLLGLALSWALQVPIESFTAWLLNAFRGYYRVGDRIEVGDVFGDVHRIDVLTTTVWEIGSPFRESFVRAEQPTGRLVTFPNNQLLTGSVTNYTRDFDYLWDELSVPITSESDLARALEVFQKVADEILGDTMVSAAREYERVLHRAGLDQDVAPRPEVFLSLEESWTNVSIRYLVQARQRRRWKSSLVLALWKELGRPEHQRRIVPALPRHQLQWIGPDGLPREPLA